MPLIVPAATFVLVLVCITVKVLPMFVNWYAPSWLVYWLLVDVLMLLPAHVPVA